MSTRPGWLGPGGPQGKTVRSGSVGGEVAPSALEKVAASSLLDLGLKFYGSDKGTLCEWDHLGWPVLSPRGRDLTPPGRAELASGGPRPALLGSPSTGEEDFPPPGRQTGSRGTKGDRGRPHGGPLALLAPPYPTVPCPAPPCRGVSGGPRCEPDVRAGWVEGGPRPWNPLQNNASTRPSPPLCDPSLPGASEPLENQLPGRVGVL